MRQFRTQAIILNRTDYGEADRILTFLTPDHGKVKAIAKGVRKQKSKLAGGIELFSVSDLSFIVGKSEINTLRSSRLIRHYGNIVKDLNRTDTAYRLIKLLDKATEDSTEEAYFNLLQKAFSALDDERTGYQLTELWFGVQLLRLAGRAPNLKTDSAGCKLQKGKRYNFDYDKFCFVLAARGDFDSNQILFLRLAFQPGTARTLQRVMGADEFAKRTQALVAELVRRLLV